MMGVSAVKQHLCNEKSVLFLLLLWAFLLAPSLTDGAKLHMPKYNEERSDTQLQKVFVVPVTGDVIVGGRNWLLRLNGDMRLLQSDRTGPVNDTIPAVSSSVREDNNASVLLGVPGQSLALYCGTARQGLCTVYSVRNLEHKEPLIRDNTLNMIGNRKSAVAFFGKGNMMMKGKENLLVRDQALYVGVSYDGRPLEYASKAVSARLVTRTPSQKYNISYLLDIPRWNQTSATDIVASLKTSYLVDYIYGFEHQGMSYFVTVQKHLPYDNNGYVTHLVRVCQDDLDFKSYTEVQLYCRKMEYQATHYDIARAAHLGVAGEELRNKFGFEEGEQVLYVAFGWAKRDGSRASPDNGSSVCMYPMSKVRAAFTKAQTDCYLGRSEWPSWIVAGGEHAKCVAVKNVHPINDSFCGRSENRAIQGRFPLERVANITTRTLVTAISVITHGTKTIAVLGTYNGSVLKVTINGNNPRPFANIPVATGLDPKVAMVTDMALSADKNHAYVLTGNRVTKVPIQSCSVHTDCATCVMADDPLGCGWCKDRCSRVDDCRDTWHNKSCPPVIHSFTPQSGPVDGGTLVEIVGDNFGTKNMPSRFPSVRVALTKCNVTAFNWTHISCITEARSHGRAPFTSDIEVSVSDRESIPAVYGSARSPDLVFTFYDPHLTSFSPKFGPQSGGTVLTIRGDRLDIGSSRSVSVDHLPCDIKSVQKQSIECETSPWEAEFTDRYGVRRRRRSLKTKGDVRVNIDNARRTFNKEQFEYAKDPIITQVYPRQSILSGGMKVTVKGENLNTVVHPRMMARVVGGTGRSYEGMCEVHPDGELMTCTTPNLTGTDMPIQPDKPLSIDVYFLMDGVENLREFPTTHPNLSRFMYYVDPTFTEFANGLKIFYLDEMVLDIWGENLDLIDYIQDWVKVSVGDRQCNVSKVGTTVLLCNPEKPPEGQPGDLSVLYPVLVTIGNQSKNVGNLQFAERQNHKILTILLPFLTILCAVGVLICVCFLKRRSLKGPWSKLKAMPGEPNVHYATGAHPESAAQREHRANHTNDEITRPVNENPYWVTLNRNRHAASPVVATPDTVLDDEARRLIDDANLLISRDHLLVLDVIGQGHFGCVYRGLLKFKGSKEEVEVAVKTLKSLTVGATHFHSTADPNAHAQSYTTSMECRKFLDEALRMREFDHPNILRLIGIALDKEDMPLVVLPFMKHGDLLSYIRNEQNSPTVKQLMDFGIQIAEGMAYLATLKFVHRDLAARNCMLDDTMNVKVADFGLSRDIYERDYYSSDDPKAKLPVKWMAPESLEKGTYDTKTDVWSYGVVLWELMTRGVCPYPEVDNWDIIKFLKEGRRMPQPSYCPDALYSVMLQCWQAEPKLRSTFEELVHDVKGIILSMERAHEKVGLNVTYVNVPVSQPYLYPQNHDRGGPPQYPGVGAAAAGGAFGGAPPVGGVAPEHGAGAGAMSNGNPRLYPQMNGVGPQRLSYTPVLQQSANANSISTLV